MVSLAIFSGNRVDGSMLYRGEPFFGLSLFGSLDLDLTSAPSELEVTIVAIFGGVKVRVRPDEEVMFDGFSLFGGRSIEPRRQQPPPNLKRRNVAPTREKTLDLVARRISWTVFSASSECRRTLDLSSAPSAIAMSQKSLSSSLASHHVVAQFQPREAAHRLAVVDRVLSLRVGKIEPVLQEIDLGDQYL